MKRELICIACPVGCTLTAEFNEDGSIKVEGNRCLRGEKYAVNECTVPLRTVTTTIRCSDGRMLPVKTDRSIPKEKIFEAMKIINKASAVLPISIGDVIIEDVFGSNIIATENLP